MSLTRVQLMNTALPTIEGLYAAYSKLFPDYAPQPIAFCVIGPTRDELAALAPTVLRFLEKNDWPDAPPALHLSVSDGDSLRSIAEKYADWFDDRQIPFGLFIALPETVKADWPAGQQVFPRDAIDRLHPTLLLTELLRYGTPCTLAALPDSALHEGESRAGRMTLGRAVIRQEDRTPDEGKGVATSSASASVSQDPSLHRVWQSLPYGQGFLPRFVWTHEVIASDEQVAVACFSARDDRCISSSQEPQTPLATHFRRISASHARDLRREPSNIESLVRISFGSGERSDDDNFVPLWEVAASGQWTQGPEPQGVKGFRGLAATQGYELKRIGDLAKLSMAESWTPGEQSTATLWFIAQGGAVLSCHRHAPQPPGKERFEEDPVYQQRLQAWRAAKPAMRVIKLHDCVDAEFLWLSMSDDVLVENIRCRAGRSYWFPSVSIITLAETMIPWPAESDRRRIVDAHGKSVQTVDTLSVRDRLQNLADAYEWLESDFGGDQPMVPRKVEAAWDWLFEQACELVSQLKPLASRSARERYFGAVASSASENRVLRRASYPPAPIAIGRRVLANENEPGRQLRAAVDLAQIALELDGAVLQSILSQIDSPLVAQCWTGVKLQGRDVRLSLGQKKSIAQQSRRRLTATTAQTIPDEDLRRLAARACAVESQSWDSLANEIVEFRNRYIGHGFQLPSVAEAALAASFVPKVERFVSLLSYLSEYMLVYLGKRRATRQETICEFRLLVHDNPIFPVAREKLPPGSRLDALHEQEVYLRFGDADQFLSLWPWVRFGPADDRQEAVWLFDGTKNGAGIYKSSLASTESIDVSGGAAALQLIGRAGTIT